MNSAASLLRPTSGLPVVFATVKGPVVLTIGSIFLVPPDGQGVDAWQSEHVRALSALLPCHSAIPPCAHGKIGLLEISNGRASSWQASAAHAALAACGNLTAGLLTVAGTRKRCCSPRLRVRISAETSEATVQGSLDRQLGGGWIVRQSWSVVPPVGVNVGITQDGRPCAQCRWLNDYAVVMGEGKLPAEQLRSELTSGGHRGKLLLVVPSQKGFHATIYNSNGAHGGMPMTGLITLGLLSQQVDWLSPLRASGSVSHRQGRAQLPELIVHQDEISFSMPPAHVVLRHHTSRGNCI